MDGHTLKNLIKKAKNGDCNAFGELYGEYMNELYRFALYTLKSPFDAEDAVQSAALTAYRKLGDLRNDGSFKSWFFKILYNECLKIISSGSRKYEYSFDDISVIEDEIPDFTGRTDLLSLIDLLSETDKAIVILSVFEGYTSKEIADIIGSKPGTVRSRLSRLLSALRKQIEGV